MVSQAVVLSGLTQLKSIPRTEYIVLEGNASNIIHDQIIMRDALFVQMINEPALFQIAPRGSAEVAVTRCRPLTCVVGFAADAPPFFTHSLPHLQNLRGAMKAMLLAILIICLLDFALCPALTAPAAPSPNMPKNNEQAPAIILSSCILKCACFAVPEVYQTVRPIRWTYKCAFKRSRCHRQKSLR